MNIPKGFPEKIYLQREEETDGYSDFQKGDRTWCEDQINDTDVEYVRADLAAPPLPASDVGETPFPKSLANIQDALQEMGWDALETDAEFIKYVGGEMTAEIFYKLHRFARSLERQRNDLERENDSLLKMVTTLDAAASQLLDARGGMTFGEAASMLPDELGKAIRERNELRDSLQIILPMAKGFAYANPVGSNMRYVSNAEELLLPPAPKGEGT